MLKTQIKLPEFSKYQLSITDCEAIGDGVVSNTQAFAKAIQKVFEAGGGTVLVPRGIWLTGPIELKSNINLHLESGAVILFSKNKEEYPLIVTDYEGMPAIRTVSPLSADHAENIAVTGSGVIDGNGHLWRPVKQFKMTERQWKELLTKSTYVSPSKEGGLWFPTESSYEGSKQGMVEYDGKNALKEAEPYYDLYRPVLFHIKHCKDILIEGVTFQNSPAWNIHPYFCENLTIRNIFVNNPYYAQNGDGLDVESCKNVHVHHCTFQTGDDAICIKSGKNAIARKVQGPTEHVHIHDCLVGCGHGGFVIGSEMSRGVHDVLIENCTFAGTDVGVRFKSALGRGGVVDNIVIKNINMFDIKHEAVIFAMNYILNTLGADELEEKSTAAEDIPYFQNVVLEGIICKGAKIAVKVAGLEDNLSSISNITVKNSTFEAEQNYSVENAEQIVLEDTVINGVLYNQVL